MDELLATLIDAAPEAKEALNQLKELTAAFAVLKSAFDPVNAAMAGFSLAMQEGMQKLMGGATAAVNGLATGIKAATDAIMGPFQQLAGAVLPFVQALNPTLVYTFNEAMRSLQATIGTALAPVLQVLTSVVRHVSGILLPAMQAIAPVMQTVSRAVLQMLLPPIRLLADALTIFAPLLQFLADGLKAVSDAFQALSVIGRTLFQSLAKYLMGLFGGDLQDVMKRFRELMVRVVESLLVAVAYFAKLFGEAGLGFIRDMANNLRKIAEPTKPGAVPAPQDVGFKGFENIAKTIAAAAFAAMPGGDEEKTDTEWLKKIAESVDKVAKDNKGIKEYVEEALETFWRQNVSRQIDELPHKIGNAVHWAMSHSISGARGFFDGMNPFR